MPSTNAIPPPPQTRFGVLAALATRRPKRVLAVAFLVAVAGAAAGSSVADRLDPFAAEDSRTESARADALLKSAGVDAGVDVVALVDTPSGATSASGRARVASVAGDLRADPDVSRVVTFGQGGRSLVARDGRSTYVAASFRQGADEHAAGKRLIDRLGDEPGLKLGGFGISSPQVNEQAANDLKRAE
ncbi:MAG: hypothetical protein H0V26_11145, partial [Solirubrobacterales bacterium]|nr:hypothetical protein [Solirubrobacterales bacterium]